MILTFGVLLLAEVASAADHCPPRFAKIVALETSARAKALGLLRKFAGPEWKRYRVRKDPTNDSIYELFDGRKPIGHLYVEFGFESDAYANGDVIGAQIDKEYRGKGLGQFMYLLVAKDLYDRKKVVFRASNRLNSDSGGLWESFRRQGWADNEFVMRPDLLAGPELTDLKKRHLR